MSYKAIDIANYIFEYLNTQSKSLTALKLQKILYYVAVKYLTESGTPLFEEKIEKWQYGPVTPSVYHAFKGRGYGAIPGPVNRYITNDDDSSDDLFAKLPIYDKELIRDPHISAINNVIEQLAPMSARQLVDLTHEEKAWSKFESLIKAGSRDLVYSNEELLEAINSL